MRRRLSIAICLTGLLAAPAGAEIVDRIAVSVGNRVITETDLDREIRITAFLNNAPLRSRLSNEPGSRLSNEPGSRLSNEPGSRLSNEPGSRLSNEPGSRLSNEPWSRLSNEKPDFSPANKRQTAERMVDQTLVRSELEASRYPPPSAADTEAALEEEKARFGDDAAYRRALAGYGVGEDDLKARLTWQLMLVRFIDVRFRPGIQIGDEEIRSYFDDRLRAGLIEAHPGQTPAVDDYRAGIEQTLIGQAANQQVEQWLKEAHRRTHIQYHDEVFR